jgi:protein phosphatase
MINQEMCQVRFLTILYKKYCRENPDLTNFTVFLLGMNTARHNDGVDLMKVLNKHNTQIGRKTDVGKVRTANEDCLGELSIKGGHLLIVADGMGGYRGGAVASHLVVETIEEYFRDAEITDPRVALRETIYLANERIYLRGKQDEDLSRMGSTCVLALIYHGKLYIAHVGDSRIYLSRDRGRLQKLTRDHTVVQHFVDVGLLSEEEAEDHPDSHILSRALGPRAHVEPEVREEAISLQKGDRILLCSDGLTKMVNEKNLSNFMALDLMPQQIAERLVDIANQNGGEDNITVLIFEHQPDPATTKPMLNSSEPDINIDFSDDTPPIVGDQDLDSAPLDITMPKLTTSQPPVTNEESIIPSPTSKDQNNLSTSQRDNLTKTLTPVLSPPPKTEALQTQVQSDNAADKSVLAPVLSPPPGANKLCEQGQSTATNEVEADLTSRSDDIPDKSSEKKGM